jgi:hypothetical protein
MYVCDCPDCEEGNAMNTPVLDALLKFVNGDDGSHSYLLSRASAKALLEELNHADVFKPTEQDFRTIKEFLPKQRVTGL